MHGGKAPEVLSATDAADDASAVEPNAGGTASTASRCFADETPISPSGSGNLA
jgi:hypothetical protein